MAASPIDDVPELIGQVILAAGEEAAQALVKHYGGTRAYLSTQRLAERVGERLAKKIIGAIGPGRHEIPQWASRNRAERDAELIRRHAEGERISCLGKEARLTPRRVRQIIGGTSKPRNTMNEPLVTIYATDRIMRERLYRHGDALSLPEADAAALVTAGVAVRERDQLPPNPALPPRPFLPRGAVRNWRDAEQTLESWLALHEALTRARREDPSAELSDRAAWVCLDIWGSLTASHDRDRAWHSVVDQLNAILHPQNLRPTVRA